MKPTQPSIKMPEIVTDIFKNEWIAGLPIEHYHGDKSAISSTGIRTALKTGRKFYHEWSQPYEDEEGSAALRLGTAAHCAILEPMEFDRRFVAMPAFGDMRSSTNRAKRDEWKLTQKKSAIIMAEKDIEKLKRIIDSLLRNQIAVNLIKGAAFEQSAYFRDPDTGLKCRVRPDVIRLDLSALPDLKTCRDASPRGFQRSIWEYRYDVQLAFYSHAVRVIHGRAPDVHCFIACETSDDFDVAVYEADAGLMDRGFNAMKKGLARIAEGVTTGVWTGYQTQAELISLPGYTDYIED